LEKERKDDAESKIMFLINFNKDAKNHVTSFGRSKDCSFTVNEGTISRFHSELSFQVRNFWLKDKDSKFGTNILITKPLDIIHN
jgi:pSer/pThr/pTyr-binding forkhead associated (FHA) protein